MDVNSETSAPESVSDLMVRLGFKTPESPFKWEVTRLNKGRFARKDHRYLVLTAVSHSTKEGKLRTPRTFKYTEQVPTGVFTDEQAKEYVIQKRFEQFIEQLMKQGFEFSKIGLIRTF